MFNKTLKFISGGYCCQCGTYFHSSKDLKEHETSCNTGVGYGQPKGQYGASVNLDPKKAPGTYFIK